LVVHGVVNICQPALSRQIRDLECELGVRLFDRIGRRIQLTAEGEDLLVRSRGGHRPQVAVEAADHDRGHGPVAFEQGSDPALAPRAEVTEGCGVACCRFAGPVLAPFKIGNNPRLESVLFSWIGRAQRLSKVG
jgi:Bacterial regulatory helix-turn-helix protein, lysR family